MLLRYKRHFQHVDILNVYKVVVTLTSDLQITQAHFLSPYERQVF